MSARVSVAKVPPAKDVLIPNGERVEGCRARCGNATCERFVVDTGAVHEQALVQIADVKPDGDGVGGAASWSKGDGVGDDVRARLDGEKIGIAPKARNARLTEILGRQTGEGLFVRESERARRGDGERGFHGHEPVVLPGFVANPITPRGVVGLVVEQPHSQG